MYTLYGSVGTRAFRVLWALEELGVPYQFEPAKPRSPEVRALNSSGKVPVMTCEGAVLTDSSAIMTFLADRHRCLTEPAGTIARAQQDALMHRMLDELDAVLWTAARHSFVLPGPMRLPDIKTSLKQEFAESLERLSQDVSSPFVMGDKMTVPDILLTHCCNWAILAKFPALPDSMSNYLREMRARPAFQRVRALAEAQPA